MFLKMPSAGHNGDSLDEWALTLFVDVLVSFLKEKRHIIPRRGSFQNPPTVHNCFEVWGLFF